MESWQCHPRQFGVNPWRVLCVHVCVGKVNQKSLCSFGERLAIFGHFARSCDAQCVQKQLWKNGRALKWWSCLMYAVIWVCKDKGLTVGLQNDLIKLSEWALKWQIKFSVDKTKITHCEKSMPYMQWWPLSEPLLSSNSLVAMKDNCLKTSTQLTSGRRSWVLWGKKLRTTQDCATPWETHAGFVPSSQKQFWRARKVTEKDSRNERWMEFWIRNGLQSISGKFCGIYRRDV